MTRTLSMPGALRPMGPVLAGALAPLGFAPLNLWPLTLLSMTLFVALVRRDERPTLCGWLYGVGFYGVGVSWVFVSIHQFGPAPIWLAGLLTLLFVAGIALFFALPAWLLQRIHLHRPVLMLLAFPAVWVLGEWFRSWFLTGFPWLLAGYAPLDTWLAGWAPVGGVYSLSYLLALAAAALWLLPGHRGAARVLLVLLLLVIPASGWWLARIHWVAPSGGSLSVAMIQGNIAQNLKWRPEQRDAILQRYLQPSQALLDQDLILWPETAIPMLLDQAAPRLIALERQLSDAGSSLISGVPSREMTSDQRWRFHNSIIAIGDGGGIYHKQRLVPFGEYVPLESWLRGLIQFFDLPMSSFSLGPADQAPLRSHGYALAPYICYEIVYPELVRRSALYSDFLLTISNDAWFGDSLAPHQHLQMARMRALENGRQLLRGTNNGISALIDHRGRITAQSPQFVETVLTGRVEQLSGTTPFTRLGSWPVLGWCGLSLIVLGWLGAMQQSRTRRRRAGNAGA